ncbi:hypothetical protein N0V85_006227, partial [Neurospora sp. IMI 360204]
MASLIDLDEYVMPDIDESDGTYSITTTPISGSDDEKEPLMPEESLPTTMAPVSEAQAGTQKSEYGGDDEKEPLMPKESLPTTAKESLPTTKASVSEAHVGTQSNLAPSKKAIYALHNCKARDSLELSFSHGDILHVISRENDHWYKAFNPAQPDKRGLVPVAYFRDVGFWDTWLGDLVAVVLTVPLCGPTKPYQPYHLLPAYNQTPYGILDCNHDATHAELWQSFFDKSTAATLGHFHDMGQTPREIECRPWKRPKLRDAEASLRSGLNKFTLEEWAIQWFFLKEDRSVTDVLLLPNLGIDTPGPISCHNDEDETSLRRRSYQYIAQMEVVRQEIARKKQLEIKELEDKKKKSEETRETSESGTQVCVEVDGVD